MQFLRPSRRELILVVLTLGVSYILFAGSQTQNGTSKTWAEYGSSLGRLADPATYPSSWSFWSDSDGASPATCEAKEDFWHGVKQYGTASEPDSTGLNGPDDEVLVSKEERQLGTRKVGHSAGWTMMERAYVYNGSVYVVT